MATDYTEHFEKWVQSTYHMDKVEYRWCVVFSSQQEAEQASQKRMAEIQDRRQQYLAHGYDTSEKIDVVDWSPK
jgi:hypothetical protein